VPISGNVSQISPPMRILLGGAAVFLALWFTVLRPKSSDTPVAATPVTTPAGNVNTGAPAESETGKLVQKAKTAAATAETAAKKAAGDTTATATPAAGTTPATTATTAQAPDAQVLPTVPAATLAKLPTDVAKALSAHKTLVLAVLSDDATHWRPMSDDDRYVRNTLSKVNRYDGKVLVKQVPLKTLMTYGPLVNALKVMQTPSVVVVDRMLKANVLTGYVDRISINQAIADARSAGYDQLITDPYLRQVNQVCANFDVVSERWSNPTIRGHKANVAAMKRDIADHVAYSSALARTHAPAKWRSLRKQMLSSSATDRSMLTKALKKARKSDSEVTTWNAGLVYTAAEVKAFNKLDDRLNTVGLTSCATNRRQ
jgi:hypothetical protein